MHARARIEKYTAEWFAGKPISVLRLEIWVGNPYDVLWEGDVIVLMSNKKDPWNPPPDLLLAHYQFDSHGGSSIPHQKSFNLEPGFHTDEGETVYIYRLFNSFDEEDTEAGDGWVVFYYTET